MSDPTENSQGQSPPEAQPSRPGSHQRFHGSPHAPTQTSHTSPGGQQGPVVEPTTPQDAPWPPASAPTSTARRPTAPMATPTATTPTAATPPAPAPRPEKPQVLYLPRPTGPNLGLVLFGLVVIAIAAGVFANQVSGFQVSQLRDGGPGVLVVAGLVFAVIGVVGMVSRRRH